MMSISDVLQALGEICTTHVCKDCPLNEFKNNGNTCPELLHIPVNADKIAGIIASGCPGIIGEGKVDSMRVHNLKIHSQYFWDVMAGKKTFDVRKNDRNYRVGDALILREWENNNYSGREMSVRITYMLDDAFVGIIPGYVVLGIELKY